MTDSGAVKPDFDVIILGAGSAGTVLGAILANKDVRVLLIDAGVHPKFAVGESTTLYTLKGFRQLAERYDIPELEYLTSYESGLHNIGPTSGVKKHFGFMLHKDGEEPDPQEVNQFSPPSKALQTGHLFRQDTDAFLFHTAIKYGCAVRQGFRVADIELGEDQVSVSDASGERFTARYLVDGSGFRSPVADKLDLREPPEALKHHSRSLFTHMINVKPTDEVLRMEPEDLPPIPWVEGTMHHMFERGWIWSIPFNNEPRSKNPLVSVGLTFDERLYPKQEGMTPEEEFRHHIARFPAVERMFADAVTVRPWVSTGRLQYSSKETVGHRWCLMSHAAGFLDPLYSRGLTNTTEIINSFAWRLLDALREDDFSVERFKYVDTLQKGLIKYNDELVNASFIAFSDYELWNAVYRVWAAAEVPINLRFDRFIERYRKTGDDGVFREMEDVEFPGLLLPDQPSYKAVFDQMVTLCDAVEKGELPAAVAGRRLMKAIEESPGILRGFGLQDKNRRFMFPGMPELKAMSAWLLDDAPEEMRYLAPKDPTPAVSGAPAVREVIIPE
ncbi:NAD(P)/FAD-dependent oxidoreductase [Streptomyces sp. TBY4]|uniref:NAD(P)/FAD-dependent oxidoreductase n=1 Tax=Streptomyces sp. TBY4 TaxID=2962030 RepID=UPI0020B6944E|nr:tryptophan 7-halogenase [Streptomyces sp. TBY4]MCP3760665.1 tryptophan 7-halogenase [Streptomyces sp. TBY4]